MSSIKQSRFYKSLRLPLIVLVAMWVIQGIQMLTGLSFARFGIFPRNLEGIWGIISSPFIHSSRDLLHIISNSPPLIVSMGMILFFFPKVAHKSILFIWFATGTLVWLFAGTGFHIGASGVVYGLVSFIFWNGVFRRNLKSIVLSLIIIILYSGMFLGILPNQPGISWESHLLGGLVGILAAYIFRHQVEFDEEPQYELEEPELEYYLERDTFLKTKSERRREENDGWFSNHS